MQMMHNPKIKRCKTGYLIENWLNNVYEIFKIIYHIFVWIDLHIKTEDHIICTNM